jgi:hypothetical protein
MCGIPEERGFSGIHGFSSLKKTAFSSHDF